MQCLDNRRLVAQHNEAHICFTVLRKGTTNGRNSWYNTPSAQAFVDKRGALVDYHDNIILPELERRGFNHRSPFTHEQLATIPEHERSFRFWDVVTWDMILKDCRHLQEKHAREYEYVDNAEALGTKTRVIRPQGHNPDLIRAITHRAISHVYHIARDDLQGQRVIAEKLLAEKLLTGPYPKKRTYRRRKVA